MNMANGIGFPQTQSVARELEATATAIGTAELEAVKHAARVLSPPSLRSATAALYNTTSQRIKVTDGAKGLFSLMRQTRQLRKKGFAENMLIGGAAAGQQGYLERFLAAGLLRDFYTDYIPTYELAGREFRVDSVVPSGLGVAAPVGELGDKPFRGHAIANTTAQLVKIAVTTSYSEEAKAIYREAVTDFLSLQLSIEVMEAVSNYALAAHLTSLEPITNFTFAPLPVAAPNIADLVLRMRHLEERLALYDGMNSRISADLAIVPRDAYETLPLLKDVQNRRLYASFEEALPGMRVVEQTLNPNLVAVIRPSEFGLAILGDLILHTDRVVDAVAGDGVRDTNRYYMTAELFVAPIYVPRPSVNNTNTYGAGVVATIPAAYSLI